MINNSISDNAETITKPKNKEVPNNKKNERFSFREYYGLTELKQARKFMEKPENVGNWVYNKTRKKWMYWDEMENIWVNDDDNKLYKAVADHVENIYYEYKDYNFSDKEWAMVDNFIVKSQSNIGIESIIKCCRADVMAIDETMLDKDKYLLNLKNGIYDLKANKFIGKNKFAFMTKRFDVGYYEGSTCPIWEKTVNEIFMNDKELVDYIQRIFGYSISGSNKEHAVFMLYGANGRNGKSTLMDPITEIMGSYAKQVSHKAFTTKGKDLPLILADVYGSRFVLTSETDKGDELATSLLKGIAGESKQSARRHHEQYFHYYPTYKVFIETNNLPAIYDDNAMWERMHLITFERYFKPEERDIHLRDKLKKEKEGILLWLLEGWKKYQEKRLIKPEKAKKHTEEYRNEFDTLKIFLEDCFHFTNNENDFITKQEMFDIYTEWTIDNRLKSMNGIQFGKEIKKRKELNYKSKRIEINRKKKVQYVYVGLRFVSKNNR